MPQLHTSLHFYLIPIVMINNSSRWTKNSSLSCPCYQRLWGSRNRRALILGYPLCTWLPSIYREHDNWYTRGMSFPILSY
ncbi:hypothetical protein AMTRI_Chr07g77620 [Amborella trichopoda]